MIDFGTNPVHFEYVQWEVVSELYGETNDRYTSSSGNYKTLRAASKAGLKNLGHDDFYIAEMQEDLVLNVTLSRGEPLTDWSDKWDFIPFAESLGLTWAPRDQTESSE